MNVQSSPSHVAVLVPSVKKAADYLRTFGFKIGEVDEFEETKEIYVEGDQRNPLLLMEPKETGSYQRAFNKRGPGIHHLAIDVLNIDEFLSSISGSGWLLHLNSLMSLKAYQTAYLARPGFPGLIEVQQKNSLSVGPLFVEEISLGLDNKQLNLLKAIGLDQILKSSTGKQGLTLQGQRIEIEKLWLDP